MNNSSAGIGTGLLKAQLQFVPSLLCCLHFVDDIMGADMNPE
jgi:hypothetical protein